MKKRASHNLLGNYLIKILLLLLAIQVALSFFFLFRISGEINDLERERILAIAKSAAASIHETQLASLEGNASDLARPEYMDLKAHLQRLRESDPLMRFAYLMRRTAGDKYIFLVDSEPPESKDYSPPGQEYDEITEDITRPFLQGIPLVAGPGTDRWGTWISALVPIRNEETGQVSAVLGIDYPAGVWRSLILKKIGYLGIILSSLIDLIIVAIVAGWQNAKIRALNLALRENERRLSVFLDQLPGMAFRCLPDSKWTMTFTSKGCELLTGYSPEMLIDNKNISFGEMVAPEYRDAQCKYFKRMVAEQKDMQNEIEIITRDNERKWVFGHGKIIRGENGSPEAIEGILLDITEKKKIEEEKTYLRNHDPLTDLYTRRYFLDTIARLESEQVFPVSFIVGNINGLGLFNNVFGDKAGDDLVRRTGSLFLRFAPEGSVGARLEGDEFALVMPSVDKDKVQAILASISQELGRCRNSDIPAERYMNLALGYASTVSKNESLENIFKEAKKMMHHYRLLNTASDTHGIMESLLTMLYEKSGETKNHGMRLACITAKIGKKLQLSEQEMNDLQLFAMLHDIGKIGIDDRILNKPGSLTADEWNILKTHPGIGYRIAMSSSELRDIAPYILSHHERWDGKGYPRGLKGEEIPALARILALADAYDAMTAIRCYREPIGKQKALEEIQKNSGTQFDPVFVKIFLECANDENFDCLNVQEDSAK